MLVLELEVLFFHRQKTTNNMRFGLVHNPSKMPEDKKSHPISRAIYTAMDSLTLGIAKSFITKLVKEDIVKDLSQGKKTMEDLSVGVSGSNSPQCWGQRGQTHQGLATVNGLRQMNL